MSFTKRFILDDEWQALTTAGAAGMVQLAETGAARLHIAGSSPSADTTDYATIWDDGLAELPFYQVDETDVVYGRASSGEVDVVVVATGSAPS